MYYLTLITQTLPQLSRVLSPTPWHAAFLYVHLFIFLVTKRVRKDPSPWQFVFSYNKKPFSMQLFEGSPDIAALKEIFLDGEYAWEGVAHPQVVVDFGAHTGNTALYFHLKYPEATIYAVEASPKSYERLVSNTKNVSNIQPIFGAVSDHDGTLTFYESESSLGSSVIDRGEGKAVTVPCFSLKTFFGNNDLEKADLMKIDIEGGEEHLFSDSVRPEDFSRSYMIEVHGDLMKMEQDFSVAHFKGFTTTTRPLKNPERYLLYALIM